MERDKVKVDMRVVPFRKTYSCDYYDISWDKWLKDNAELLKKQGYVTIESISDNIYVNFKECWGAFALSDFEPYAEPKSPSFRIKSGRKHGNQYSIVLADGRKGEAPYNAEKPYLSVLEAFCRATNAPTDIVDMLFKKPVEVKETVAEPVTFESGETVRINPNYQGEKNNLPRGVWERSQGKLFVIDRIDTSRGIRYAHINGLWFLESMLEKIPQPAKLEVTINGEKYIKEESK
jgi:hypothetical protein